jgi:hypothetical protein
LSVLEYCFRLLIPEEFSTGRGLHTRLMAPLILAMSKMSGQRPEFHRATRLRGWCWSRVSAPTIDQ